jgi:mRNA interferase HigB
MIVVGRDVLDAAGQAHRSRGLHKALAVWARVAEEARWRHFPDVRQSWPSADYVAGYVVFNVKGNQFRLVANANYRTGVLTVVNVMTPAEYNEWSEGLR